MNKLAKDKEKKYLQLIKEPPEEAKVYTRWWWFGCSVNKREINRELDFMKKANIGGVEIQVLYPIQEDSENANIKHKDFFSKEFFEIINYTINKCVELEMKVDFTLGSSWPFGGPFITHEMAPYIIIPYQQDITGPTKFNFDYTGIFAGEILNAFIIKKGEENFLKDKIIDVTEQLQSTWIYNWPYGYKFKDLEISKGDWRLILFVSSKYRQQVGIPTLEMNGFAIDHCRKDVSDYYFRNLLEPFVKKVNMSKIRSFFCDSIELAGNNWTPILLSEFKKRRGYPLEEYMPALWVEVGDISPYIRYDYYKTLSELTIENFFENFTNWCNKNGSKSRIQAHGTWGDILKAYAAADIPEGETFGPADVYEVNTIHRRLASSAGNIYGKHIISNESFTWLRMPRFLVTLEMIKLAADAIFLDGVNHIVNHGYAYSPKEVGKPGWVFYASSLISHTNTWWNYYPEVSKYICRVSAFMQRGHNYSEVGIYLPQNDVWSDTPMSGLHLGMKLEEYMGREVVNSINKNGYWFNYLNDEAIQKLGNISNKGLELNKNQYKVIVLINSHKMPYETAKQLKDFVEKGGILIATKFIPTSTCSFIHRERNNSKLSSIMEIIFPKKRGEWKTVGKGRTIIASDDKEMLIKNIKEAWRPDLEIKQNNNVIGYVHRKDKEDEIYFISNISREKKFSELKFKITNKGFIILDPLTQKIVKPSEVKFSQGSTIVKLNFDPVQSYLIIFSENIKQSSETLKEAKEIIIKDISQNWEIEIEEMKFRKKLAKLTTWENFAQTRYYCGEASYKKSIKITAEEIKNNKKILISFTTIKEVAEVFINGVSAGVLWKNPYQLDIKKFLRIGKNTLRIKAVNLWINHCLDPNKVKKEDKKFIIKQWPYFAQIIDNIREKRLDGWRERAMVKKLQPSGLTGRVSLKTVV